MLKKSLMAAILVAVSILGVYTIINNMPLKKYEDLVETMTSKLKEKYKKVSSSELKADKEYKYSYTKGVIFFIDGSEDFSVSVVKYKSNYEAEAKKKYIADANALVHKKYDNTFLAIDDNYDKFFSNYEIIVKGKYLFSINPNLKDKKDIIDYINKIIKEYDTKDETKSNKKKVDAYWKESLTSLGKVLDIDYEKKLENMREAIQDAEYEIYTCEDTECEDLINSVLEYEAFDDLKDVVEHFKEVYYE